jgi:hypothetical protein
MFYQAFRSRATQAGCAASYQGNTPFNMHFKTPF